MNIKQTQSTTHGYREDNKAVLVIHWKVDEKLFLTINHVLFLPNRIDGECRLKSESSGTVGSVSGGHKWDWQSRSRAYRRIGFDERLIVYQYFERGRDHILDVRDMVPSFM